MRKAYTAAILFWLLAPACAVFRSGNKSESDSISLRQEVHETRTALSTEAYREVKFSYADSGKSTLEVRIIPDGEFVYSPEAGFQGKASALFIKGMQQNRRLGAGTTEDVYKQAFDSITASKAASLDRLKVKEKSSLVKRAGGWKIGGLVLVILIIGLVIWRMGSRFFSLKVFG